MQTFCNSGQNPECSYKSLIASLLYHEVNAFSPRHPSPWAGCRVALPSSQYIFLYWAFLNITFFFFNLHRKQKNPFCWICFWSDSLNATRCYKILNIFHFRLIEATDTIEHNLLSFKWKRWKMGITLCPPSVCLRNILARGMRWCTFKFLNYSFTSF